MNAKLGGYLTRRLNDVWKALSIVDTKTLEISMAITASEDKPAKEELERELDAFAQRLRFIADRVGGEIHLLAKAGEDETNRRDTALRD